MPGSLIKARREKLHITQHAMAGLLYMSQSNYSKIENNKIELTVELAKRIVVILQIKLEDILPDSTILESAAIHQERKDSQLLLKMETIMDAKLLELKQWMSNELSKKG
jgi:transcriptional regulator with XRE-family HTH domain